MVYIAISISIIVILSIAVVILYIGMKIYRDNWFESLGEISKYKYTQELPRIGKQCTWVTEHGGYFAYCHKDGRLIMRTGRGEVRSPERTWSSVGTEVLERHNII